MSKNYNCFMLRWKEERLGCGLTQKQLCRCTEMVQSSASKAETGRRRLAYPEIKKACASGMDIFYIFTGIKSTYGKSSLNLMEATPEELLGHLSAVYVYANAVKMSNLQQDSHKAFPETLTGDFSETSCHKAISGNSFQQIREQLEYLRYMPAGIRANQNVFYCVRKYHGYTQEKMAGLLGMDIKTLRALEKGKRFPDSETLWKMYCLFHVSPAFLLMDAKGLRSELNYVLSLLTERQRDAMLRILENGHDLIHM